MPTEHTVMGLFTEEDRAVSAIEAIKDFPWKLLRVHSPIPSHKISKALKLKKSMVGWFTLAGGITGFCSGFLLAIYTASQWDLIISGKPIIALVPFLIVGFEFTILFSVFGNVVGLIHQMQLPDLKGLKQYDPRCSGHHFGVTVSCGSDELEGLKLFFQNKGGEVTVLSNGSV
jgi:Alternative complex III, ActD subunit